MVHARGLTPLLLISGVAIAIAVAAAVVLAADQPAAPQPQRVRFVSQFIAYTPKDATTRLPCIPRWAVPICKPGAPFVVREPDGHRLLAPLGDLAPEFGPLDALKGRDPKAIEELLTRLDDRWNYYIETLSASGPMGDILSGVGGVSVPLRTYGGTAVGPADVYHFLAVRAVRVDRVVGNGRALMQILRLVSSLGIGMGCMGGDAEERVLGAPCLEGGVFAEMRPYKSAAGVQYPDVVLPGFQTVLTVELGQWETQQGPTHN